MTGGVYREGLDGLRAQIAERRAVAAEAFARLQALAPFPWVLFGGKAKDEIAEGDADASAIVVEAQTETDPGKLVTKLQELDVIVDHFDSMRKSTLSRLVEMGELEPDDPPGVKLAPIHEDLLDLRTLLPGSTLSSTGGVVRAEIDVEGHPVHVLAARCYSVTAENTLYSMLEEGPVWPYYSLVAAVPVHLPSVHVYIHDALATVISMFAKPVVPGEPVFHRHFSVRGDLDVARAMLRHEVCRVLAESMIAKPRLTLEKGRLHVSWMEEASHVREMLELLRHCLDALTPRR